MQNIKINWFTVFIIVLVAVIIVSAGYWFYESSYAFNYNFRGPRDFEECFDSQLKESHGAVSVEAIGGGDGRERFGQEHVDSRMSFPRDSIRNQKSQIKNQKSRARRRRIHPERL